MENSFFRNLLMEKAKEEGFLEYEIYFQNEKNFEVLILEGEISHYENSSELGICFRGNYEGHMGYAYSEEVSCEAVDFLIKEARENAQIIEDSAETLYVETKPSSLWQGLSEELKSLSAKEKIDATREMETSALFYQEEISGIGHCSLNYIEEQISIVNSKGLNISYSKNLVRAYISATAQKNGDIRTGSKTWSGKKWLEFSPKEIGRIAAKRAINHLGAYSIKSGEYHVLLENQVISSILFAFSSVFFAENVHKGFSLLGEKCKEKIASSVVTLCDDGLLKDGLASAPFDSEGVPCENKTIIDHGRLEGFLYNLKSAAKDGTTSTGNGFKESYRGKVQTSVTNFYLQSGLKTPRTLMALLGDGIFITDISGIHAGTNAVSGDFSLFAEGFVIERGKIIRPVEQITISGNFYTLLKNIEEVANDLSFFKKGRNQAVGSGMVMIKKMMISGS